MAIFSSLQAATNITLIIKQTFTVEENYSLKPDAKNVLATDSALNGIVTQFEKDIQTKTTISALKAQAELSGLIIFNHAVQKIQTSNIDDRPLFWARNRMSYMLKTLMNAKPALNDTSILKAFERKSRGYDNINFTGLPASTKRVLVTGFDPFYLDYNLKQSNPSGCSALYLHNKTITSGGKTAKIQVAIIPVRYADFDLGIIDNLFKDYIKNDTTPSSKQAAMIITFSQGLPGRYDVERFAAKFRDPRKTDNLQKAGGLATFYIPSGANLIKANTSSLPEFIETELPTNKMVPGTTGNIQTIYNQKWITGTVVGSQEYIKNSRPASLHTGQNVDSGLSPTAGEPSLEGSGQNYLSNEIFYRVALLRTLYSSTSKTGHLHVPDLEQTTFNQYGQITKAADINKNATQDLVFGVADMVKDAISGL